jgi:pre-mRNA-splicing factor SYF2
MVAELNDRAAKRSEYSRRRAARSDADVDFINPRNAHFNKKLDRAYGGVTKVRLLVGIGWLVLVGWVGVGWV